MVFSEFGQERREGNDTEVLLNIIDEPLFWDRDYISFFLRWRKAGFVERGVEDLRDWSRQEIAFSFNNQTGMPSNPYALEELSADSVMKVENSDIVFTA